MQLANFWAIYSGGYSNHLDQPAADERAHQLSELAANASVTDISEYLKTLEESRPDAVTVDVNGVPRTDTLTLCDDYLAQVKIH